MPDPFKTLQEFEAALIVEYLHCTDIVRLQLVSRLWRQTLNSNFIGKVAFLHHFPLEAAGYRRLAATQSRKEEVAGPDFTAIYRNALRRYINLRNGTPHKARDFDFPYGQLPRRRGVYTKPWGISEGGGFGPEYVAWVVDECIYLESGPKLPMLTIVKPDGTRIRAVVPVPGVCKELVKLHDDPEMDGWKVEANFVKVLEDVVVVRSEVGANMRLVLVDTFRRLASVFHGFSADSGDLLWEHIVHYPQWLSRQSSDHVLAGQFDLVYDDGGKGALLYLFRQGIIDDISINLVDLHTGVKTSEVPLNVGLLDLEGRGLYSPVNPLCRDVKFSKNGHYLATVTLRKNCAQVSRYDFSYLVDAQGQREPPREIRVPLGAQHSWGQSVFLNQVDQRVYCVYIHDLKTGQLVLNHELERPYEPNNNPLQAEFSPKIHFSVSGQLIHIVEETYVYKTRPVVFGYIPGTEHLQKERIAGDESVVNSYGWTINLQKLRATPTVDKDNVNRLKSLSLNTASSNHTPSLHNSAVTQRCINRTMYTSGLVKYFAGHFAVEETPFDNDSHVIPLNPYRIETFLPEENLSIIRYHPGPDRWLFDVANYLDGPDVIGNDGMKQATLLMRDRRTMMDPSKVGMDDERPWKNGAWGSPATKLGDDGDWSDALVINERCLGIWPWSPNIRSFELRVLSFGEMNP